MTIFCVFVNHNAFFEITDIAIIQRDKKTYAVAPHIPCGVVKPKTLRKLADVADKYDVAALKIASAARIAIVGVDEKDVDAIWDELIDQVIKFYRSNGKPHQRLGAMIEKMGFEEFKAAILGDQASSGTLKL